MSKVLSSYPEYAIWSSMKGRCFDPNNKSFANYGGRGIKVCKRWKDSFISFLDDMGPRPEGLTLERIDNNGNYGPRNCVWETRQIQNRNKRPNKTNVTGVRGVGYYPSRTSYKKFNAFIKVDGKSLSLGWFETLSQARCARWDAEFKYWGSLNSTPERHTLRLTKGVTT